jgi:hypothetical protein
MARPKPLVRRPILRCRTACLLAAWALAGTAVSTAQEPVAAAALDPPAWMAGHWSAEVAALGGTAEEVWLPPTGGAMPGMFRLVRDGRAVVYELVLIEREAEGTFLRFKHVGPGWRPFEETPLVYLLSASDGSRVVFENVDPAPPERVPSEVIYERTHPDSLRTEIRGAWGDPIVFRLGRVPRLPWRP